MTRVATPAPRPHRIDLLRRWPGLAWLLQRRWFQFALVLPNLLLFVVFLLAGFWGSPVGNHNVLIVGVWILWWFLLISVLLPFAGRLWCTMCPFPFFGEWLQRGALLWPRLAAPGDKRRMGRNRAFGLTRRWPRALANIWLQNLGFLALCTFSALYLTRPLASAVVLTGLVVLATALHLVYRQRAFCSYVCPVSGFLSLYSMTSMLEVRARDPGTCLKCQDKGCLAGNERGFGCPWFLFPSQLDRNNYCGLCLECLKSCPHDNMTVNARAFAADTRIKGYDEAFKALIMVAIAGVYSVLWLGPWGELRDLANVTETGNWRGFALYAAALWALALVVLPGLQALAVLAGRRLAGGTAPPFRAAFLALVYPLVPLGLLAWIAFSLPLVLVNGSYVLMVLSDPMGWGWDLFGTAHVPWTPVVPHLIGWLQAPLLLLGLAVALRQGHRLALALWGEPGRALRGFAPTALLLGLIAVGFLTVFLG